MYKIQKHLKKIFSPTALPRYKIFQELMETQSKPWETIRSRQLEKLNRLLIHARENVPYYRNIFSQGTCAVTESPPFDRIEDLNRLPVLTKDIIRSQKEDLCASGQERRKPYPNTSGGTTGEPVSLIQDFEYYENSEAHFLLIQTWRGAGPFDSTLHLWGAERDTYTGKKPLVSRIKDFLKNRITLNSFSMSEQDMAEYIAVLNRHRPRLVIAYAQSIYELAKFARTNKLFVEKQQAIHTSASTLYGFMREEIETVFSCKCFDHYGSREVGAIASECPAHSGLHLLPEHLVVEITDSDGRPCAPGVEGDILVTTLNNYSMPLIRYRTGDRGILAPQSACSCGCNYPKLLKVSGRSIDLFKTADGKRIDGEFFTHLFYNMDTVKQFQVVQKSYDKICIKIVQQQDIGKDRLSRIEKAIKRVMGNDCIVEFQIVNHIEKTGTGKQLYTISKVR